LQTIRNALARVLRALNKGKKRPKIKKHYGPPGTELVDIDNATGLVGTAGPPATPAQGAAEALSQLSKGSSPKGQSLMKGNSASSDGIRMEGLAFLTTISPKVYDETPQFALLTLMFEKVLFEWERTLPIGSYKIYRMYDEGHEVIGGSYVTWAIATSESRLALLSRKISNPSMKIEYWKTIKGAKTLPPPKTSVPRYRTIRQG
jgi:hypothetical protein